MNATRLRRSLVAATVLLACALDATAQSAATATPPGSARAAKTAKATFAGGSFWSMEAAFDRVMGVLSTTSGYTGGSHPNPSYEQVVSQQTDHAEAVEVVYDPGKVSYEQLLAYFWRNIDPTARDRQFCDEGASYRTAIFAHDEEQRQLAQSSKQALQRRNPFRAPIVTKILRAGRFHAAEDEHQDYYRKNPDAYRMYSDNCGRESQLQRLWSKGAVE